MLIVKQDVSIDPLSIVLATMVMGSGFMDVVQSLLDNCAFVRHMQFEELSSRMSHAGNLGQAKPETRFVIAKIIVAQLTLSILQGVRACSPARLGSYLDAHASHWEGR